MRYVDKFDDTKEFVDPVCNKKVRLNKTHLSTNSINYRDVDYHFCSENCKMAFVMNPDLYLKKNKK